MQRNGDTERKMENYSPQIPNGLKVGGRTDPSRV